MLRESAPTLDQDVDMSVIMGQDIADSPIPAAETLNRFIEALIKRTPALDAARTQIVNELGYEALVDAAATIGSFQRNNRIADAAGLPLETPMLMMSSGLSEELGATQFGSAKNSAETSQFARRWGGAISKLLFRVINFFGR